MSENAHMVNGNNRVRNLLDEVAKADERMYIALFGLYVAFFVYLKLAWKESIYDTADMVRFVLLSLIIWGSAIYLFVILISWLNLWNKTLALIFAGGLIVAITGYASTKMSTNSFGVVMDLYFCAFAYGKQYKKILRCTMWVTLALLILAGVGVLLGITGDVVKPNNVSPGHSLGINYPNNWAYLVFLVVLIAWYLYLRFKPIYTFALFWSVSAFMFFYISCRTIAGIMTIFPFLALWVDWVEKRTDLRKKQINEKRGLHIPFVQLLVIGIPYLAFGIMFILSMQVEWLHKHFYYTPLHNLAMRFVQGGLYFRTYGIPVVGNPYRGNVQNYQNVNGEFLEVGILDSSFASYIIMRGLLWIILVLAWLCFANYRALKNRDFAIPLLCSVMLGFAMMERPGLELWFNFVLLYPLANVVNKQESVTESNLNHSTESDNHCDSKSEVVEPLS